MRNYDRAQTSIYAIAEQQYCGLSLILYIHKQNIWKTEHIFILLFFVLFYLPHLFRNAFQYGSDNGE